MSIRCTTHFHACDCREEIFKELKDRLSEAEKVIENLYNKTDIYQRYYDGDKELKDYRERAREYQAKWKEKV